MRWRESSKRYAEKMAENLRFDWCEVKGLNFWFWMLNMAIHGWLKLKISAIHPSGWHWRLVLARGWLCTVHAREGSADSKTVGHNKIHGSVWYVRIVLKYLPWKRDIFFLVFFRSVACSWFDVFVWSTAFSQWFLLDSWTHINFLDDAYVTLAIPDHTVWMLQFPKASQQQESKSSQRNSRVATLSCWIFTKIPCIYKYFIITTGSAGLKK